MLTGPASQLFDVTRVIMERIDRPLFHMRPTAEIAQSGQSALDAPVTPARIVRSHLQHQPVYRLHGARPSRSPARVRLPPPDQTSMPA